jgi:hypothetical protein
LKTGKSWPHGLSGQAPGLPEQYADMVSASTSSP